MSISRDGQDLVLELEERNTQYVLISGRICKHRPLLVPVVLIHAIVLALDLRVRT